MTVDSSQWNVATRNKPVAAGFVFLPSRNSTFTARSGFLFILVGPRAETVAIPRHARFERRQFELLPNLLGALLLVRERATGIPALAREIKDRLPVL